MPYVVIAVLSLGAREPKSPTAEKADVLRDAYRETVVANGALVPSPPGEGKLQLPR